MFFSYLTRTTFRLVFIPTTIEWSDKNSEDRFENCFSVFFLFRVTIQNVQKSISSGLDDKFKYIYRIVITSLDWSLVRWNENMSKLWMSRLYLNLFDDILSCYIVSLCLVRLGLDDFFFKIKSSNNFFEFKAPSTDQYKRNSKNS